MEYCSGNGLPGIQFCVQDHTNKGKINFATGVRTGDTGSSRVNVDLAKSVEPVRGVCRGRGWNGRPGRRPDRLHRRDGDGHHRHHERQRRDARRRPPRMAADFVVVVVGLTPYNEGEQYNGNDRENLSLDGKDHGRGYGASATPS